MKINKQLLITIAFTCISNPLFGAPQSVQEEYNDFYQKIRARQPLETKIKTAIEKLRTDYPDAHETAVGESMFLIHLYDSPKNISIKEVEDLFISIKKSGSSKWYTAISWIIMASIYEIKGMHVKSVQLAKDGMRQINWSDVKKSYNEDKKFINQYSSNQDVDNTNTDDWRSAMENIANSK